MPPLSLCLECSISLLHVPPKKSFLFPVRLLPFFKFWCCPSFFSWIRASSKLSLPIAAANLLSFSVPLFLLHACSFNLSFSCGCQFFFSFPMVLLPFPSMLFRSFFFMRLSNFLHFQWCFLPLFSRPPFFFFSILLTHIPSSFSG